MVPAVVVRCVANEGVARAGRSVMNEPERGAVSQRKLWLKVGNILLAFGKSYSTEGERKYSPLIRTSKYDIKKGAINMSQPNYLTPEGEAKLNAELQVVNAKLNIVYNYYKLQREIGTRIYP